MEKIKSDVKQGKEQQWVKEKKQLIIISSDP